MRPPPLRRTRSSRPRGHLAALVPGGGDPASPHCRPRASSAVGEPVCVRHSRLWRFCGRLVALSTPEMFSSLRLLCRSLVCDGTPSSKSRRPTRLRHRHRPAGSLIHNCGAPAASSVVAARRPCPCGRGGSGVAEVAPPPRPQRPRWSIPWPSARRRSSGRPPACRPATSSAAAASPHPPCVLRPSLRRRHRRQTSVVASPRSPCGLVCNGDVHAD